MVTAQMVSDLRRATGAGMMDCKQALTEADGDIELANDLLRKKGKKIADKKGSREATEGLIGVHIRENSEHVREKDGTYSGAMVMVNCETDFVAKNEMFQAFVKDTARRATMAANVSTEELSELIQQVGENIVISETIVIPWADNIASYVHNSPADDLGTIAVIMNYTGGNESIAKQICMHIAATKPKALSSDSLDQAWVEKERQFFIDQAVESGKPPEIAEKMVTGRMKKVLKEVCLLDQKFVMDETITIEEVLKEHELVIHGFKRLAISE